MSNLPLENIKVLEFSHAVMGPSAGLVLADLGAEVIHIEPTTGDHTRRLKGFGTGYFTYFNRNKKSLAVNLKTAEGHAIICKMLETADVLIENFAPNTMQNLGLGYGQLREAYPQLIYCSLKGFLKGPYEQRPALDEVVQMMSGLAYMTGPVGQPLRAGASIVDIMGGTFGAMAILVALMERRETGKGKLVQNGLFETASYIMGQHMAYSAISQEKIPPMPARVSAWAIYRTFFTQEAEQVFIGITSDKHWERFCEVFNRPDLAQRAELSSNNQRIAARDWLLPDLEAMFATMPKTEILSKAEAAEIPFAPIAHPEDLFEDPQLNQGGSLLDIQLADGRSTKLPKLPMSIEGDEFELRLQAPKIGEHSQELLQSLGYSEEEITQLMQAEIIACHEGYQ